MATTDTETTLYNDLHTVKFKNGSHRYYVDGSPRPGVTTIMGKVLAKPDLMLWPLNMALKYLTMRLPTITAADLEEARLAHIRRRDKGADTGTLVHSHTENFLRGNPPTNEEIMQMDDEVQLAFGGFMDWVIQHEPTALAVEQLVYSHLHKFAGTFDSILKIADKVYLCDLKTTNASQKAPRGIYAEYFIQLGAYYYAYEEQRQYELAHGGSELVAIDDMMVISCKKNGKVDTLTASDLGLTLADCMKMWECTLFLHNDLSRLKAKLGG